MARKTRDEAEIAATVAALPTDPPEDMVEDMIRRGFFSSDIILYRAGMCYIPLEDRRRKMVLVHCTACGEETYLEHVPIEHGCYHSSCGDQFGFIDPVDNETKVSYSTCICPSCGKGMQAMHISRFRHWHEIDRHFFCSAHNVRGHLCLLSWTVSKNTDKEGNVRYFTNMWEGAVIVGGCFTRVVGYTRFMSSVSFNIKWEKRSRGEDFIGACGFYELYGYSRELAESTDSANSALFEYVEANKYSKIFPGAYMQAWCKHPNIENLVRGGCGAYVGEVIEECVSREGSYYAPEKLHISASAPYINFKEVKPHRMLGLEKNEMHIAQTRKIKTVEFYREIKQEQRIKLDDMCLDAVDIFKIWQIKELTATPFHSYRVPIVRMLGYLMKQKKKYSTAAPAQLISPVYLRDYWDAVYKVYGKMERSMLYPKDLVSAHDRMILQVKEKEDAELNAKIAQRLPELELRCYQSEALGLMIRPAATQGELIKEGKFLHHCVGGYAKSHAEGKTSIYFIRRIDAPEIPFYTLEYKNGNVQQNRGDHNCAETTEVAAFKEEWLLFIKTLKETKETAKRRKAHA